MTRLVPSDQIEAIVGAERDQARHIARAVLTGLATCDVYILHAAECLASGRPLAACPYSVALDELMLWSWWRGHFDRPVYVRLEPVHIRSSWRSTLVPDGVVS